MLISYQSYLVSFIRTFIFVLSIFVTFISVCVQQREVLSLQKSIQGSSFDTEYAIKYVTNALCIYSLLIHSIVLCGMCHWLIPIDCPKQALKYLGTLISELILGSFSWPKSILKWLISHKLHVCKIRIKGAGNKFVWWYCGIWRAPWYKLGNLEPVVIRS